MSRKVIIKCKINLPASDMQALEKKLRRDYDTGLMLIPYYCDAIVADDVEEVQDATDK